MTATRSMRSMPPGAGPAPNYARLLKRQEPVLTARFLTSVRTPPTSCAPHREYVGICQ